MKLISKSEWLGSTVSLSQHHSLHMRNTKRHFPPRLFLSLCHAGAALGRFFVASHIFFGKLSSWNFCVISRPWEWAITGGFWNPGMPCCMYSLRRLQHNFLVGWTDWKFRQENCDLRENVQVWLNRLNRYSEEFQGVKNSPSSLSGRQTRQNLPNDTCRLLFCSTKRPCRLPCTAFTPKEEN